MNDELWTCWGDAREPELEATESECKEYVEIRLDRTDLYITDSKGAEYIFDAGSWVQA